MPINSKENVINHIRKLEQVEGVLCASPNYIGKQGEISNADLSYEQWALSQINGINLEKAWEFTKGSSTVKVGIIDSGFVYHEDITINLEEKVSFLKYKSDGSIDQTNTDIDINGDHGTKIAGIIGANHNGQGINGICENVSIVPLVVNDSITQIIKALEYSEKEGIKIVNMSLWNFPYSAPFETAISDFDGLVICISGNGNLTNIDEYNNYPACFTCNNMIVVGALDEENEIASFSNYGATSVDIYAPGENVLTTFPGYVCDQDYILNDGVRICELNYGSRKSCLNLLNILPENSSQQDVLYALEQAISLSNETNEDYLYGRKASTHVSINYHNVSGTSYAAPHVAGVAALLLSINPNLDTADLKSAILDSADLINIKIGSSVRKLNAYNAIKEILIDYSIHTNYSLNSSANINFNKTINSNSSYFNELNGFYELTVSTSKYYNFNITTNSSIDVKLFDNEINEVNFNDLESSNSKVNFRKLLYTGKYYLWFKYSDRETTGTINTKINIVQSGNVINGNNNILSNYSFGVEDYIFTNNNSAGFYKITLNATKTSGTMEYQEGCIKVYADEAQQQLLTRLETGFYTLEAETQADSNNIIVFLEYGQTYYINIDLPNYIYSSMNINIEKLVNTYDIVTSNNAEEHVILDENTSAYGDFMQRIEILQAGTYTVTFTHDGPQDEHDLTGQVDPQYIYYVFFKEVSSPAELFEDLELLIPQEDTIVGNTVSFTFGLQPGVYYIGYYNKLNNQPMTISISCE